jgi:hypothetical protein
LSLTGVTDDIGNLPSIRIGGALGGAAGRIVNNPTPEMVPHPDQKYPPSGKVLSGVPRQRRLTPGYTLS